MDSNGSNGRVTIGGVPLEDAIKTLHGLTGDAEPFIPPVHVGRVDPERWYIVVTDLDDDEDEFVRDVIGFDNEPAYRDALLRFNEHPTLGGIGITPDTDTYAHGDPLPYLDFDPARRHAEEVFKEAVATATDATTEMVRDAYTDLFGSAPAMVATVVYLATETEG